MYRLLQQIAARAYEAGYKDAKEGKLMDLTRVEINQQLMRKFL